MDEMEGSAERKPQKRRFRWLGEDSRGLYHLRYIEGAWNIPTGKGGNNGLLET